MKKTKVLFMLSSLTGGGTERVILHIIRYMNKHFFDISLAVINIEGYYAGMLPNDVSVYAREAKRARYALLSYVQLIGKIKPDIVFSSTPHIDICAYLALKLTRCASKLVIRSQNFFSKRVVTMPWYIRLLMRLPYRKANIIIATTTSMKQDLQDNLHGLAEKIKIIPNPIDLEMIRRLSSENIDHHWFKRKSRQRPPIILAIGRLIEQKGFSYLIKAFSIVVKEMPSRLVILGKGKLLKKLQILANELSVSESVDFIGFQENPFKYLANADIFVLSSIFEGFPNALVEAMACEIPVMSTDCPSGPNEIITPRKNGLLVPVGNPEALAEAIMKLLKNKRWANRLAKAGEKRAEDFTVSRIVRQYENVFADVLK